MNQDQRDADLTRRSLATRSDVSVVVSNSEAGTEIRLSQCRCNFPSLRDATLARSLLDWIGFGGLDVANIAAPPYMLELSESNHRYTLVGEH